MVWEVGLQNNRSFRSPIPPPAECHVRPWLGGCASRTNPRSRDPFPRAFPEIPRWPASDGVFERQQEFEECRLREGVAIRAGSGPGGAAHRRSARDLNPSNASFRSTPRSSSLKRPPTPLLDPRAPLLLDDPSPPPKNRKPPQNAGHRQAPGDSTPPYSVPLHQTQPCSIPEPPNPTDPDQAHRLGPTRSDRSNRPDRSAPSDPTVRRGAPPSPRRRAGCVLPFQQVRTRPLLRTIRPI